MENHKNKQQKEPSLNVPDITRENYERIKALREGGSRKTSSNTNTGTRRTSAGSRRTETNKTSKKTRPSTTSKTRKSSRPSTSPAGSKMKLAGDSDLAERRARIAKKNSTTASNSKRLEMLRGESSTSETRRTKTGSHKSTSGTNRRMKSGSRKPASVYSQSKARAGNRQTSSSSRFSMQASSGKHSYSNAKRGRTVQSKAVSTSTSIAARASARRARRQEKRRKQLLMIGSLFLLAIVFFAAVHGISRYMMQRSTRKAEIAKEEKEKITTKSGALKKADLMALGYDYDGAIDTLKSIDKYESDKTIMEKIQGWESEKENLIGFSASEVTHIFYHTLVVDPDLAFGDAPAISNGFKQWMTTVDEFNKITQKMYDDGYVLVGLYDFFDEETDSDGNVTFTEKKVYLPKGKTPFILSLDDLSYYHTYTDHGMATKLVIGDDGKVTCEYVKRDGSTVTGSYDCVPLIDDFMEEHPDGAYHGARGTIALTGYNGVFGYRTDMSYVTKQNLDEDKQKWLEANPDFDHDEEVEGAIRIAEALKEEGWTFASHTWGHLRVGRITVDKLIQDTEKWLENVSPIIGPTDCIIFAHGQDMSSDGTYSMDNDKYAYLKSKGFHVFLNVDSHKYTMEIHERYVHGGRRNLDGYRLWEDAHGFSDWTSDLFDAADILDSNRTDMPEVTD